MWEGENHYVCAPTHDGGTEMRVFGATTPDLLEIAAWFQQLGVASVALESTGVYWIPLFEVLDGRGIEVILTDTRQLSRSTGAQDRCRGLPVDSVVAQLRTPAGLFPAAGRDLPFLRSLVRGKAVLVAERSDWLRRMQKCLDQMNVRVHRAVADVDGVTGMAILRAIVARRRARSTETGPIPRSALSEKRGGDSQGIERELAPGPPVQPGAELEDVRSNRRAHRRLPARNPEQDGGSLHCERADQNPIQPVKKKEKCQGDQETGAKNPCAKFCTAWRVWT